MGATFTEGAIQQHIAKLRTKMATLNVAPVPGPPKRGQVVNQASAVYSQKSRAGPPPQPLASARARGRKRRASSSVTTVTESTQSEPSKSDTIDLTKEWLYSQDEPDDEKPSYTNMVAKASGLELQLTAPQPIQGNEQQMVSVPMDTHGLPLLQSTSKHDFMKRYLEVQAGLRPLQAFSIEDQIHFIFGLIQPSTANYTPFGMMGIDASRKEYLKSRLPGRGRGILDDPFASVHELMAFVGTHYYGVNFSMNE